MTDEETFARVAGGRGRGFFWLGIGDLRGKSNGTSHRPSVPLPITMPCRTGSIDVKRRKMQSFDGIVVPMPMHMHMQQVDMIRNSSLVPVHYLSQVCGGSRAGGRPCKELAIAYSPIDSG